ncbi:MAG: VWA domain-containing protein [Candidatus Limnocylindrales bacterium]
MTLLDPERLALILLPIALAVGYVLLQRRRARFALRFSSVDLFDGVAPDRPGWRRHLAAGAYLAALALLVLGMARPVVAMQVPNTATIMLAVDVSYSMNATDVSPNRLAAAEDAATRFVDLVPSGTRLGLIAFSGAAQVVVAPTTNLDTVRTAIHQLKLGPGTAIGEAIYLGLQQLPKGVAPTVPATASPAPGSSAAVAGGASNAQAAGAIVLLSDGQTTVGRPDADAAAEAAAEGVPVSTIAFGTSSGSVVVQGQSIPVPVDAAALRAVAQKTGGQFFTAASADQVRAAFEDLGKAVGTTTQDREVTDYLVAAALGAAVLAAGASLAWFSRLP